MSDTAIPMPGDVSSPSSASGYLNCGYKWYARHVLHLDDPKTGALLIGTAVHAALGENFAQKVDSKRDLPAAGVTAVYRESWDTQAPDTEFRDDEDPATMRAQGEALALLYLDQVAPSIEPAAVELRVAGFIGGVSVRGYVDVLDVDGRIIDIKTAARKPSGIANDYRFQIATYSRLTPGATGASLLSTITKTKAPALVDQAFMVDQADVDATEAVYPLVQRSIRAGVFNPNRSSHMCSKKYCSFWRSCEREFGGRVSD